MRAPAFSPLTLSSFAAALLAAAAPSIAQAPDLAMLDGLEKGQWVLRDRDDPNVTRSYCVADWRQLLQLQHPRATCSRTVLENSASAVTVHYTCPGAGHGRTSVRRETNRLVQIDTQGIAAGSPFSMAYEARKTGPCT